MKENTKKILWIVAIVAVIIIFIAIKKKQENEELPYADIPPRGPAFGKPRDRYISEYKKAPDIEQNMPAYDVSKQDVSSENEEDNRIIDYSATVKTASTTEEKRVSFFDGMKC